MPDQRHFPSLYSILYPALLLNTNIYFYWNYGESWGRADLTQILIVELGRTPGIILAWFQDSKLS